MYVRAKDDIKQKTQYVGNSMKSMHISIEDSLKKLRTSYIDILFVHFVRTAWLPDVEPHLQACLIVGLHHQHPRGDERPACTRDVGEGPVSGMPFSHYCNVIPC